MGGLDLKRLVLVRTTVTNDLGLDTSGYGTGYFITNDLVLTAAHVLLPAPFEIKVRVEVQAPGKPRWLKAQPTPAWADLKFDAALLRIDEPLDGVEVPQWRKAHFDENTKWDSAGYPRATAEKPNESNAHASVGLSGVLYARGGGGEGLPELELGVEHESGGDEWRGISGAPIFVGDELVGIIKSFKKPFKGKRLYGVPIQQLLRDPAFQRALRPQWLPPLPQQGYWILILTAENSDEEFSDIVKTAIEKRVETVSKLAGLSSEAEPRFVEIAVTDVLTEPARWYEAVEAICAAPIMVVDVTRYQPAVMVLLGIRAVARRGVTITATSDELDETLLKELPFNIQETKLIYRRPNLHVSDLNHPVNRIGEAVVKGLRQLREHRGYLDLPVYDAVRCPKPPFLSAEPDRDESGSSVAPAKGSADRKAEPERILMLCSFNDRYREHWRYVSEKITLTFKGVGKSLERMLDISSPRLVGQALYESIRWTPCCIVDWTHWRANVFFELGVRLACSDIGPIGLIEEQELKAIEEGAFPLQKRRLVDLLRPISYKRGGPLKPFKAAFERYHSFLQDGHENVDGGSAIPHNATYRTVVKAYDWRQEAFASAPHEELRASVEALQGKDPQKVGFQALFSTNPEFNLEIQRNGRERWIAAWSYFRKRYVPEDLESEDFKRRQDLRKELSALTERVNQELRNQPDPDYQRIYKETAELIDQLDRLDAE